jgi:hypothetical protein
VTPVGKGVPGEVIQLVEVKTGNAGARKALAASGLDLTEHVRPDHQEVLVHGVADLAKLRALKLPFTVQIADVVAADRRGMQRTAGPDDVAPLPSGRTQYRRLADFEADMKALAEANPGLVKPLVLPERSLEGRAVQGIEMTEDVAADDGKPVFFNMGVHHAREWPSAEMPMEWAIELVKAYRAGNARATKLLRTMRVIMVPIINPDGYNLSRESMVDLGTPVGDPGFAYKRKNCRMADFAIPAPGVCGQQANRALGTDPNRNYGGFWGGPGADAENRKGETFRGTDPFSEPETRNVRHVVSTRQVTTLITNHTYSDLVLRPPGLVAEGDPPDEPVYKALGDAMAKENGYLSQKSWELYDTTGTTEDWSYYATGGLGFTFEIGKASEQNTLVGVGFHPPYPVGVVGEYYGKEPSGGGNREAYYVAAESTANRARHSILQGRAPAGATLRVKKAFETFTSRVVDGQGVVGARRSFTDTLEDTLSVPSDGAFQWAVNPSTRPFARKARVDSEVADAPSSSQTYESALPSSPPGGGADPVARRIPITVTAENGRLVRATLDGDEGDDWDLYLLKDGAPVASAATSASDETLIAEDLAPGTYELKIDNWLATQGYTGTIATFGAKPGTEKALPTGPETWTMTCEIGGRVAGLQEIGVERGEAKSVEPCGPEAKQEAAQAGVLGQKTTGSATGSATGTGAGSSAGPRGTASLFAFAIDRRRLRTALARGMRTRARCTVRCTASVALTVSGTTAKRLGLARTSRRAVVVARGSAGKAFTGRRTFTVRFTKAAKRRLAGARSVRLSAAGTAKAGTRTMRQRSTTTLR